MKITYRFALVMSLGASVGLCAEVWEFKFRPASASYSIYGNSLGDPTSPSAESKKIAFGITGKAAQEIFDAIGPDRKDSCLQASDVRFRSRDKEKLVCTKDKAGNFVCSFGFDLVSGKSVGGSIC